MSQYFQVEDHVLWNPSNGVAGLFVRSAEALAPLTGLPTGLGPMNNDECEVDVPAFTAFVRALVECYESSNHPILHSLMDGFIATALVLIERGGGDASLLSGDQQLGGGRWAALSEQHARAMPC